MTNTEYKVITNHLTKENKKYTSDLVELASVEYKHMRQPIMPDQVWRSNRFLVQIFNENPIRLSIQRTMVDRNGDWLENIEWHELQKIKDDIGFSRMAAVELYPPKKDIVNVANIRHLWVLDSMPDYMWRDD